MKNTFLIISTLFLTIAVFTACSGNKNKKQMEDKRTRIECQTTMGNFTVALYNETPKHRENFIKLVKEGTYDSTLFHRVINKFMIQAGDPQSKTASDSANLGNGDVGYTIDAEFMPEKLFHKRGALAAAREGDQVNPEKRSSGCQFYVVTGRKFNDDQILSMEKHINDQMLESEFYRLARKDMDKIQQMQASGDNEGLMDMQEKLEKEAFANVEKKGFFKYSPEQVKVYKTIGGTPHLDGAYTVFGEVVDGMDTIEKIEVARTNKMDRPLENIRIISCKIID